jgi:hypothetical protein
MEDLENFSEFLSDIEEADEKTDFGEWMDKFNSFQAMMLDEEDEGPEGDQ